MEQRRWTERRVEHLATQSQSAILLYINLPCYLQGFDFGTLLAREGLPYSSRQ